MGPYTFYLSGVPSGIFMVNTHQDDDRHIAIGEGVAGSTIVSGDGNKVAVHYSETKIIQNRDEVQNRPLITISPYKGLKTFGPEDKDLFFGRHQFVTDLIQQIERTNLILLLGASGSGKSSVIRAGLIPQLAQKYGTRFTHFMFTPDHDPYESLYGSLLGRYKQAEARMAREAKAETLTQVVTTLKTPQDFWFIVIDQFEELFTISAENKRARFIAGLVKLSQHLNQTRSQSVKLVATMRADFLDRLSPYPAFVKITEGHRPLIAEMQTEELRAAIELPAARNGVTFENTSVNLVDEIIKDVKGQAGCLPLLQYTLNLLWEQEVQDGGIHDRMLNYSSYCSLGGVQGALQQHVDSIYRSFSVLEQAAAKKIFLKIVEIGSQEAAGTECQPVRRRASKAEFTDAIETTVLMRLIDENLLVSSTVSSSPIFSTTQATQSTIEIAHEILLTSWTTLNDWIKENREAIALRNRLNDDVALWQQKNRADSELWSRAKLEQALELRRDSTFNQILGGLSQPANQFIDASLAVRERQRRRIVIGLSGFSAITLLLSGFALYQLQQAQRKQVEHLIETSKNLISTDKADATLNAIAAKGLSRSFFVRFPHYSGLDSVDHAIFNTLQYTSERNRISLGSKVYDIAFSPDGKLIASGSDDGNVRRWDVVTNQQVGEPLQGHTNRVNSVAFSPDGKWIVSGSADGTLRRWDAVTGQVIGEPLKGHTGWVNSVVFSPDGRLIASGGGDGTVRLWDAATGQAIGEPLQGHTNWVYSVAFSPDGKLIASGSGDGTVRLWDAATGQAIGEPLQGHTNTAISVAFSPDGKLIASGSLDETIRFWDTTPGQSIGEPLQGYTNVQVASVAFSPDGKQIVSGGDDNAIRRWDVMLGQSIGEPLQGHTGWVNSVVFSPDGKLIASGSRDGTIRRWDAITGQAIDEPLQGHTNWVNSVAFSPDSKLIVSGSGDGTIRRWDVATGQAIGEPLQGHTNWVSSVVLSPDGHLIASGSGDGTIRRWDAITGQAIDEPLQGHTNTVNSIAFSRDSRLMVSGSSDGTIRRWDASTGQAIGEPLQGHINWVNSVAVSSDGHLIASGSSDSSLRLWNAATGQPIGAPLWHWDAVYSVAFSPDGKAVASGSSDYTVRLWSIFQESWLQTACEKLQYHSLLLQPTTDVAKEAKRTCDRSVYSTPAYKLEKEVS